jgi:hypothetical protein
VLVLVLLRFAVLSRMQFAVAVRSSVRYDE